MKNNINSGLTNNCQICNKKTIEVLDLGHQPLADDLIGFKERKKETIFFPIIIGLCKKCILLQNNYIVDHKKLYKENYHYRPGITPEVIANFKLMAEKITSLYNLNQENIICDIGCNDGSLLEEFKKKGFKNIFGIEPTNTVSFCKKKKIKYVKDFCNISSAKKAIKFFGKADIVLTTNVFAHTNKLGDFINGVKKLIDKKGVFIIENHYLLDVINKNQFDTFYHEHLRTYSLTSLIKLLKYYGFNILNAFRSNRYGGNIQAHFTLENIEANINVKTILKNEKKEKLDLVQTYQKFKIRIDSNEKKLTNYLQKNIDKKVYAKAFPARASILLHYFSSLKKNIKIIAEQPTSLKINKFAPGTNIKILSSKELEKDRPDIVIVLAWHLFESIYKKWKPKLKNTKFVRILPKFKVY